MEGVGARAVVGVVVVAALVGLGIGLLLQGGGDDGESTSSSDASTEPAEEESEGTGEFEAESGDELPVELAAGDALRVVVEGGDVQLYLAASEEAQTDGFEDLEPRNQVALGGDLDVGLVFLATDRSSDDVEGLQFVAPTAGTYTVLLIGPGSFGSDEDESVDVTIEVEPGDDEGLDPDDIEFLDYLAHYGEHVDFFCDEDFFGGDPEDVTNYGPTVCDDDTLAGVLEGEFNGDFTNDFEVGT